MTIFQSKVRAGAGIQAQPQGLPRGSMAGACPGMAARRDAKLSASSKAGRTRRIWERKASLAFSKAASWAGKARAAALTMGSTRVSVSIRYESCFCTEKALPMVEWLWNLSAAFTRSPIISEFYPVTDDCSHGREPRSAMPLAALLQVSRPRYKLHQKRRPPNDSVKRIAMSASSSSASSTTQ